MDKMTKLINEYVDTFQTNFPLFCVMGASEEDVVEMIEECLKTGKPYEPEKLEEDAVY